MRRDAGGERGRKRLHWIALDLAHPADQKRSAIPSSRRVHVLAMRADRAQSSRGERVRAAIRRRASGRRSSGCCSSSRRARPHDRTSTTGQVRARPSWLRSDRPERPETRLDSVSDAASRGCRCRRGTEREKPGSPARPCARADATGPEKRRSREVWKRTQEKARRQR